MYVYTYIYLYIDDAETPERWTRFDRHDGVQPNGPKEGGDEKSFDAFKGSGNTLKAK
jgi:hypothetical protein